MALHLHRDLEHLKEELLHLGSLVEEATDRAITALLDRDPEMAGKVLEGDNPIDEMEVKIEEDALKILALHQPVAVDLRLIVTVLKVTNDLERVGDLAVNLANRAIGLAEEPVMELDIDVRAMSQVVRGMVHDSLESLVSLDVELARNVCGTDATVDSFHREMYANMEGKMRQAPENIGRAVQWISASRHLERIADLATNVAEDVIFMVTGEVVRHRDLSG